MDRSMAKLLTSAIFALFAISLPAPPAAAQEELKEVLIGRGAPRGAKSFRATVKGGKKKKLLYPVRTEIRGSFVFIGGFWVAKKR